jgi:hypothetical protein
MILAKQKNDVLQTLLEAKLSSGELTFARFMGTAEQLYLSVLDNVRRIVDLLRSIESIDTARINDLLDELKSSKTLSKDEEKVRVALETQKTLYQGQIEDIHKYLRENEEVLAMLDTNSATVAKMETSQSREATTSLESAMEDMRNLVNRAKTI